MILPVRIGQRSIFSGLRTVPFRISIRAIGNSTTIDRRNIFCFSEINTTKLVCFLRQIAIGPDLRELDFRIPGSFD